MTTQYPAQARLSHKSYLLATVATLIAAAIPTCAIAGQAAADPAQPATAPASDQPPVPDTVVVTGFRRSLEVARNLKKLSNIEVDVIVAEDMAKFPELNLAESLQRLPGVQITREAGEGRRISLRGLGPDFARVQLNGMEVLGNVDSAQDSRGQRSRDRSFDFNIFASELFSKADVEKTYEAAQQEGGMAGTVGLFTGKPFDYAPGTKAVMSAKLGTNQYTKDAQPRLVGLFSQNWDNTFGITISATYSKRRTTEEGHDTYNYTHPSASDMAALVAAGVNISALSPTDQAKFLSGDLYFADGNRLSSWDARQERLGLTGAVQWRPADNLLLTLDLLHSQFTTHRDEYHFATRPICGPGSTTLDCPAGAGWPAAYQTSSTVNALTYDNNGYVTSSDVSNVTFGSEHRRELNKNNFNQGALTYKWDASDKLKIDGHVGIESSKYDTPYDDKLYMRAKGNLIANYGANGQSASFSYPGTNLTDPSIYILDDFYYRAFWNESKLAEGTVNLHYAIDPVFTFRAGAAYHHFSQSGANYYYDGNVNGTNGEMRGMPVTGLTDVYSNAFGSWLVGDFDKTFAAFNEYHRLGPKANGVGGSIQDIEQVFTVKEGTFAGYAQMDWDSTLFGKHFRGNVGLRGYHTDTESLGWIQGNSYAYLGTADVKGHYSGVLPALNAVVEMTPELLVRFAATQNLNRPSLTSLAAEGSASADSYNNDGTVAANAKITASRGNPALKPFKDTTLDLAVEYYFGKIGLLSAGVFQKWITNFFDTVPLYNIPFSQTGLPLSSLKGVTPTTIVSEFDEPLNQPGTKTVTGIELAAQAQFSFLPKPFDKLGALGNFTYVNADQALTGISPTSFNATLYYETKTWGARVAVNHRSLYYTGHNSDPMSAGTQGYFGATYVDAAAFWNITPKFQFTLDAINLTNQTNTQFWGQAHYLYNQTQSGATYLAGISYKF
jgi:TonB-dependent receptor